MSYEPTIVILKKDLDKHRDLLLDGAWQYDESEQGKATRRAFKYIKNVYEGKYITVGGMELIICQPELSSFNQKVRNVLTELNVEFGLDN